MIDSARRRHLIERARRWLVECPICDYGIGAPCACPDGDYRDIISELVRELEEPAEPDACALCGIPERGHGWRAHARHQGDNPRTYVAPTDEVRLDRMKKRRERIRGDGAR